MTPLLRIVAYPALLFGSVLAALIALGRGAPALAVVVTIPVIAAALVILLERVIPYRAAWRRDHGDLGADALHLVVSNWGVTGLYVAAGALWVGLADALDVRWIWPDGWPLVAQVGVGLALTQLLGYGIHRAFHGVDALWRIHAVHHGAPRLYWLNTYRIHPIEALAAGLPSVSLVLAGAPGDAIAVLAVIAGVGSLLQHANLDTRSGALGYVFSTPEQHRWHHATERRDADASYGGILLVWDWVFGTGRRWPPGSGPGAIGVPDRPPAGGYVDQLRAPWR